MYFIVCFSLSFLLYISVCTSLSVLSSLSVCLCLYTTMCMSLSVCLSLSVSFSSMSFCLYLSLCLSVSISLCVFLSVVLSVSISSISFCLYSSVCISLPVSHFKKKLKIFNYFIFDYLIDYFKICTFNYFQIFVTWRISWTLLPSPLADSTLTHPLVRKLSKIIWRKDLLTKLLSSLN